MALETHSVSTGCCPCADCAERSPQGQALGWAGFRRGEVTRGILFHAYECEEQGRVAAAGSVVPINQNHGKIQKDMEALTPGSPACPNPR